MAAGDVSAIATASRQPVVPALAEPRRSGGASRVAAAAGIGAAVAAGALLRLDALGRQPLGSDVAVVGLMARAILHGHVTAFYWGQRYGGGEPYVVALLFALFGSSAFTLGLAPVLLDAVAALLVWRIGRRLFSPPVGVAAALLFWVWPEVELWQSTLEYGFRFLALDCGLAGVLAALALTGAGRPRRAAAWWTLLGAAFGLGWWCTPEIAYFALPTVLVLGGGLASGRVRPRARDLVLAASASVGGAAPWLWSNVRDGFASLRAAPGPQSSYGSRLGDFVRHVVPMELGLRLRTSGGWLLRPGAASGPVTALAVALALLGAAAVAAWVVALLVRRRALVVVGFVAAFPFLYAAFPETWFWADGRYAVYLAPVVALLVASGAAAAARRLPDRRSRAAGPSARRAEPLPGRRLEPALLVAVVVAGLATTLVAATQLAPYRPEISPGRVHWTSWRSDPNVAVLALARGLERAGVRDAYAGYWLAYVLDFESGGRVVASDPRPVFDRDVHDLHAVESSARAAWLFENPRLRGQAAASTGTATLDPGCAARLEPCLGAGELERWLAAHRDRYRVIDVGDFVAVEPARPVDALAVLEAYRVAP